MNGMSLLLEALRVPNGRAAQVQVNQGQSRFSHRKGVLKKVNELCDGCELHSHSDPKCGKSSLVCSNPSVGRRDIFLVV